MFLSKSGTLIYQIISAVKLPLTLLVALLPAICQPSSVGAWVGGVSQGSLTSFHECQDEYLCGCSQHHPKGLRLVPQ